MSFIRFATAPSLGRLAFLLLLLGLLAPPGRAQFGPMVPSVEVGRAEQREVARSLEFTGSLEPYRAIELAAQVAGLVTAIPIEEGQAVDAGDVVAQLDTEAVEIEVDRTEAQLARARAELARLRTGFRTEEIEEARRALEEARVRADQARREWERRRELVDDGVISADEAESFETALLTAEAAQARAQAILDRLEAGYRTEEIDQARAEVAAREADLAEARRRLARHEIEPGFNGVVVERLAEPGEWIEEGEAVARLVVLDPLKVRIEVPQSFIGNVKPGQKVLIRIDGLPNERFEAEVEHIIPSAGEGTRNFPVVMHLANPERRIPSGLFARVMLNIGDPRPSILVPREAVQIRGETLVVQIAQPMEKTEAEGRVREAQADAPPSAGGAAGGAPQPDATIREVEVQTGTEVGDMIAVEVIEGEPIRPGDRVVVLGGSRLSTGMPVRILDRGEAVESGRGGADARRAEAARP